MVAGCREKPRAKSVRLSRCTPPRILSKPGAPLSDGEFRYRVEAVDPDGDRMLRYELAEGPDGMTIDSRSGQLRWKPTREQIGNFSIAVVVDDLNGGKSRQRFDLSTAAPEGGAPPPASAR